MIEIVFEGDVETIERLDLISAGLTDLAGPTQEGLEVLSSAVFARVDAWIQPDILPESRANRRVDGSAPPLMDSGEMVEAAAATAYGVDHSMYLLEADGLSGQIGVESEFHGAQRHQFGFGTDRRGRHFDEPARAFLVFGSGDAAAVAEVFDVYLHALLGAGER